MQKYTYQAPFVKNATKKSIIYNSMQEAVGAIQRYYPTFIHYAFDWFAGRFCFFVSFRAFNLNEEIVINASMKNHLLGVPDYYIEFLQGEGSGVTLHAKQENEFDVFTPEFLIKGAAIEIYTKKSLIDVVQFYENGQVIARWHCYVKEKFKASVEIKAEASIQDPLFYALIGQMFYMVGS